MKKFIHYDPTTGEIKGTIKVAEQYAGNISGTSPEGLVCIETPDGSIDDHIMLNERYYDGGLQVRSARPSDFHVWTAEKTWSFDRDILNSAVRSRRNNLLKGSDWTQVPDSPLSDAVKAEWAAYRQALRDVPATTGEVTTLEEVVWPTPPSSGIIG